MVLNCIYCERVVRKGIKATEAMTADNNNNNNNKTAVTVAHEQRERERKQKKRNSFACYMIGFPFWYSSLCLCDVQLYIVHLTRWTISDLSHSNSCRACSKCHTNFSSSFECIEFMACWCNAFHLFSFFLPLFPIALSCFCARTRTHTIAIIINTMA